MTLGENPTEMTPSQRRCLPLSPLHGVFPVGENSGISAPCRWDFGSSILMGKFGTLEFLVCNSRI